MERHQFVRENPELAKQQDIAGDKLAMRAFGLLLAGVISIGGTLYLVKKEEFHSRIDSLLSSLSSKK